MDFGKILGSNRLESLWVEDFGVHLNAWRLKMFKSIEDQCSGFIEKDEDTKNMKHLYLGLNLRKKHQQKHSCECSTRIRGLGT